MTIKEYYSNYKTNKEYPIKLESGTDTTIEDFYKNCIHRNILKRENVLAWHEMFMEYVDRPDAVFWVRYFEYGPKINGVWNTRRGCLTRFADGFAHVFVSNFDAHEILNMVRLGVTPDVDEFVGLMNSLLYPMHYCPGDSCAESKINAFPNVGSYMFGILNSEHWYLAHINGIKAPFFREDGSYNSVDSKTAEKLYPIGELSDWKLDKVSGKMVRNLPYSLTDEEKNLVKAHFLRFVDPLNYYVVPGPKRETNSTGKKIGEYEVLNNFISSKFETLYGLGIMDEFREKALIKKTDSFVNGNQIINISYGSLKAKKISVKGKSIKSKKEKVKNAEDKIGQYAKIVFQSLLEQHKLGEDMVENLMDKNYCSRELGVSYPVLVIHNSDSYDRQRYYKIIVIKKYLICSQWYAKSRIKIDAWRSSNGL